MNKIQTSYLLVAVLSFLAVIVMLFFAATASKNPIVFSIIAVLFALNGAFWACQFAKRSRRRI